MFLIDKAEYPFSLMKFFMLIYFNLVVPKRVKFCENESLRVTTFVWIMINFEMNEEI